MSSFENFKRGKLEALSSFISSVFNCIKIKLYNYAVELINFNLHFLGKQIWALNSNIVLQSWRS